MHIFCWSSYGRPDCRILSNALYVRNVVHWPERMGAVQSFQTQTIHVHRGEATNTLFTQPLRPTPLGWWLRETFAFEDRTYVNTIDFIFSVCMHTKTQSIASTILQNVCETGAHIWWCQRCDVTRWSLTWQSSIHHHLSQTPPSPLGWTCCNMATVIIDLEREIPYFHIFQSMEV